MAPTLTPWWQEAQHFGCAERQREKLLLGVRVTEADHGQVFFQATQQCRFLPKELNHTLVLHRAGHQPSWAGP